MRRLLSRAGVLTIAGVVGLTASLVGVAPGGADPGDQDASFGAQGVALAPTGTHLEQAYGDVDVVASLAGESWTVGTRGNGPGRVLQILRHSSDGTDPAAGAARVVHDLGTLGYASAATEDGLGGAYVVVSTPSGTGWAPMLGHVLADRTLDAVFGQKVLPGDLGRIEGLDVARHTPTGALFVAVMHRELIDRNVTARAAAGSHRGGARPPRQSAPTSWSPPTAALWSPAPTRASSGCGSGRPTAPWTRRTASGPARSTTPPRGASQRPRLRGRPSTLPGGC